MFPDDTMYVCQATPTSLKVGDHVYLCGHGNPIQKVEIMEIKPDFGKGVYHDYLIRDASPRSDGSTRGGGGISASYLYSYSMDDIVDILSTI